MYLCLCNNITHTEAAVAIQKGFASLADLQQNLGVADCCGQCARKAQDLLNQMQSVGQPRPISSRLMAAVQPFISTPQPS